MAHPARPFLFLRLEIPRVSGDLFVLVSVLGGAEGQWAEGPSGLHHRWKAPRGGTYCLPVQPLWFSNHRVPCTSLRPPKVTEPTAQVHGRGWTRLGARRSPVATCHPVRPPWDLPLLRRGPPAPHLQRKSKPCTESPEPLSIRAGARPTHLPPKEPLPQGPPCRVPPFHPFLSLLLFSLVKCNPPLNSSPRGVVAALSEEWHGFSPHTS